MTQQVFARPISSVDALSDVFDNKNYQHLCDTLSQRIADKVSEIDQRLSWVDLSSSERSYVRICYEMLNRTECPFPLRP